MKKILNSILLIALIFFSIIGYLNYCYSQGYTIIEESKPISIIKGENQNELTNEQYVDKLIQTAKKNNVELTYLIHSTEGNKPLLNYYMTDTEIKTNKEGYLNYPGIFNRTKVNPFEEVYKYQIDQIQIFVDGTNNNINNFIEQLNANTIEAYEITNPDYLYYSFFSLKLIKVIIILYGVIFFIFLFYQITKSKKLILRKLNGYSLVNSLIEDLINFNKIIFRMMVFIFIVSIFLFLLNLEDYLLYLNDYITLNIKVLILYNLFYIATFLLVYMSVKISALKNNIIGKKYFSLVYIFKFGLLIVLMVSLVSLPKDISSYNKALLEYNKVKDLYNYSYIPTYSSTLVEDEKVDRNIGPTVEESLEQFYYLTVENLSGIVGAFSESETITEEKLQQLREETGDPSATFPYGVDIDTGVVNGRYLELNKIYDENGNLVEEDNFPEDKLTFLVPEKYKKDEELDTYLKDEANMYCQKPSMGAEVEYYSDCKIQPNVVFIKNNSQYSIISQETTTEKYMIDPIVTVITQDSEEEMNNFFKFGDIFGYVISSGGYIVKTNQEDPYKVVKPYIQEANLENTIRETPLLSNYQLQRLIQQRNELVLNFLTIIFLICGLIGTIYYLTKTSILLNNKKYGLQLINGEKIISILKIEYIKVASLYIMLIILLLILSQIEGWIILGGAIKIDGIKGISTFSIYALIMIIAFEVAVFKVMFKKDIVNRLKENIKGDN